MITVPFTQFMRPFGTPVPVEIDLADEVKPQVDLILSQDSLRFTVESLMNGSVSACISDELVEDDYDMALCMNGPRVPVAIKEMIMRFKIDEWKKWREDNLTAFKTGQVPKGSQE